MKRKFTKWMWGTLAFLLVSFAPKMTLADPVTVHAGQIVSLSSLHVAGDIVLCDPGVAVCSANTRRADIEGVGVFYNLALGPFTPDEGIDANTVTFLVGSQLMNFLNNFPGGFSLNAIFLDASATGSTQVGNFIFVDDAAGPTAAPEPSTLVLLGLGFLGMAGVVRRYAVSG